MKNLFGGQDISHPRSDSLFAALIVVADTNHILMVGRAYRYHGLLCPVRGTLQPGNFRVNSFQDRQTWIRPQVPDSRQELRREFTCLAFSQFELDESNDIWDHFSQQVRRLPPDEREPLEARIIEPLKDQFPWGDPFAVLGKRLATTYQGHRDVHEVVTMVVGQLIPASGPGQVRLHVQGRIEQQAVEAIVLNGPGTMHIEMQHHQLGPHAQDGEYSFL